MSNPRLTQFVISILTIVRWAYTTGSVVVCGVFGFIAFAMFWMGVGYSLLLSPAQQAAYTSPWTYLLMLIVGFVVLLVLQTVVIQQTYHWQAKLKSSE